MDNNSTKKNKEIDNKQNFYFHYLFYGQDSTHDSIKLTLFVYKWLDFEALFYVQAGPLNSSNCPIFLIFF